LGLKSIAARAVMGVLVAGVVSCAALDRRAPQEIVKERAQARWDALVKSDLKTAYSYLSPGSRAVITYDGFVSGIKPGFWKSAVVEKVICETADSCVVGAKIEYEFMRRPTQTALKESWVREDGKWWFVYQ
jgi:hypothetical protein